MKLAIEQRLPVAHQRAADFHHHFVPLADVLIGAPEFVGDPGAADHGQRLVHQQQLAMIAVEVANAPTPVHAVVEAQDHTRVRQARAQAQGERQRAEVIEQATHDHAASCGIDQRLHHGLGAGPRLHQVQLQLDLLLRAFDGRDHAREEGRPVDHQVELVFVTPREDRASHAQRAVKISTAPTGTEKPMADRSATLRKLSSPGNRPKSSACSTSGSRVTT